MQRRSGDLLALPGYAPIEPTDVLAERYGIAPEDVVKLDGNENPFGPSPRAFCDFVEEDGAPRIVEEIVRLGGRIHAVERRKSTLESRFLALLEEGGRL